MKRDLDKVNRILEEIVNKNEIINGYKFVQCDWSDTAYTLTTVSYCTDEFIITFEQYFQMGGYDETKIYSSVAINEGISLNENEIIENGNKTLELLIHKYLHEYSHIIIRDSKKIST